MMKLLLPFLFVISYCKGSSDELKITPMPVDAKVDGAVLKGPAALNDPDRFVWGASVVKGPDGKYHMFYSCWDAGKANFSDAWLSESTIAYAISDQPDRNFRFQKIILGRRSSKESHLWDANSVHNPHIKKFNGKYYLYYIGNTYPPANSHVKGRLNARNQLQQNQCMGVIEANSISDLVNGQFKRPDQPLLKPRTRVKSNNVLNPSPEGTIAKPDNLILVNPAVAYNPNTKKYHLYFKGNLYQPNWKGVHGVAISDSPTGPFEATDKIVFNIKLKDGSLSSAEDPYVWYHKKHQKFYAVLKDFHGDISKTGTVSLAILESNDGFDFEPASNPLFMNMDITLTNGEIIKTKRLERPQLLIDNNGDPIAMYAACAISETYQSNTGATFNVQIPLRVKK